MTTSTPTRHTDLPPNHHAAYPTLAGVGGLVAALTFTVGRGPVADLAIALTDLGPDDDIVDVGCGPGVAARAAAATGAAPVTGVDPAPVMLRVGRTLDRLRHHTRPVRYLDGTAEHVPLPDRSVSVLWSLATVHHWSDLTAGLQEATRVLRPSGRLLAIERLVAPGASGHASHGWTDTQAHRFAEECQAAGFTDIAISHHRPKHKPLLAVLATRP